MLEVQRQGRRYYVTLRREIDRRAGDPHLGIRLVKACDECSQRHRIGIAPRECNQPTAAPAQR